VFNDIGIIKLSVPSLLNFSIVKELIVSILNEILGGKLYDSMKVSSWSKTIADSVKAQVKTLGYERYVQSEILMLIM